MEIFDESAKRLACAVLVQTINDIRAQAGIIQSSAECDVQSGGIDLYLALMDVDISPQDFIARAKRGSR